MKKIDDGGGPKESKSAHAESTFVPLIESVLGCYWR